jgi:hypothetical protein
MGSQRWVSDMQSHYVLYSGPVPEEGDAPAVDGIDDNVVALFAPRESSVAAIIAAASGPAEEWELAGEDEIRATFRAVMLEAPSSTPRRHRLAPFAIAAGSVVGLVAGTAGLSAAAVLPPAANHVMARVLAQVGIDVAPTSAPAATTTAIHSPTLPVVTTPAKSPHPTPPRSSSPTGAGALAPIHTPPTHVVRTCNTSVTVGSVRSNVKIQVTASNAAAAVAATPSVAAKGHCSLNRGTPSTGTPSGGKGTGGGPGTGNSGTGTGPTTGPGTGTGTGKGTNKGGHHGKGHHGKHRGQGGTGTGAGTGTGSGTGTAPISTTTTTVPSSGPVTSDDPIGSPS